MKSWFIRKDPDAGKGWRQKEKGSTEDEMVGWHPWLNEHEFEQTPGDGEGQGSLVCFSPWGRGELDMTEQLNNNISVKSAHFIEGFLTNVSCMLTHKLFSLVSSTEKDILKFVLKKDNFQYTYKENSKANIHFYPSSSFNNYQHFDSHVS